MKKFGLGTLLRVPTEPKDLFPWLIKRALLSLGFGGVFGYVALIIAALSLFGFLIGDYSSTGNGNVSNNASSAYGVTLGKQTSLKEKALLTHDNEVGDTWQKGLSPSQISQVEQQQVDLPGAVLLGIGKMENNLNPPNASQYYRQLQPKYTWHTYTDVTIYYWTTCGKTGCTTYSREVDTPKVRLMTANIWDGTLTDTYHWVTHLQGSTSNGVYTKKIELASSHRTYSWSRVWSLFRKIPAQAGNQQTFIIQKNSTDRDTLAGLIAAVDYSIADPYVQKMVSVVLFPGGISGFNIGSVSPPSANVIQNILRWKTEINQAALTFHIPAVLIAGVMYQESGGREHAANGALLISSAGAVGLMQVEPSTAAGMTLNGVPVGSNALLDLANPVTNIQLGAMYLAELYDQFGQDPVKAESAYNAGPGAEQVALAQGHSVAQNAQTLNYVSSIQGSWIPALTKYFGPESPGSKS